MALNCEPYTLSYSESSKGWPSFYSFTPEFMIGMNSFFYNIYISTNKCFVIWNVGKEGPSSEVK